MRGYVVMVLTLGAAAVLTGCGKKEEPVMPQAEPVASAAPAASSAPTGADQLKLVAALPAPYNSADPTDGMAKVAQCKSCHTFTKGGPALVGPNLYGVFGTKAAAVPGFNFSDGMKASGLTWDAPTLDHWIENPKTVVPDTKMTFAGMKDAKDRQNIIAYLATLRD